jgi:leucyl aminopeptidase
LETVLNIEFVKPDTATDEAAALVVTAFEDGKFLPAAQAVDSELSDTIRHAIGLGRFKGRLGECLSLFSPRGICANWVLVVGAGDGDAWDARSAELWAAHAYNAVKTSGADTLLLQLSGSSSDIAAHAAFGVRLAAYRFDRYRTREKAESKPSITSVKIATDDPEAAAAAFERLAGLADAICFVRDLVSEPANVLYPAEFARRVKGLCRFGLNVEILGRTALERLGMGALLGVGQGSTRESQLAIIEWQGARDPAAPPIAFIGKGVCFDTGGVNLKRSEHMEEMIIDMSGAAAVAGAMYALAARKAKVNAVGILGLVENMPDGNAQRPGDVVTTMSGQTVEVINTDAEGRLVLADALWYCQSRFRPKLIVDLATLTGVIMTALGGEFAGLFSNDDALANNLLAAASRTNDLLWRLPLHEQYEKALESRLADMRNVGDRYAGAITAALFLKRFVNDVPWAHLDVGMTVWKTKSTVPTIPDGATGFGVRLLDRLVSDFYEDSPRSANE